MIQGLYAAANGMMAVEDRQAAIANNIANASTPGFKRQLAVQMGFYKQFNPAGAGIYSFNHNEAPGGGMRITETFSDYSNGVVMTTGRDLDLAILGPGFVAVDGPNGELFTRNGKFSSDSAGTLMTDHGYPVASVDGEPINVAGGSPEIDRDGKVTVNGEARGQIRVVEFEDPHMLSRAGYSLYAASPQALTRSGPAARTVVNQGALEASNVQLPYEISHMLMALRAYAANQKAITSIDETAGRMIDQVGVPG